MNNPLHVTERDLTSHVHEAGKIIVSFADGHPNARLTTDVSDETFIADLAGFSCERIERNRGPRTNVLPIISLTGSLWAWVGYRESWKLLGAKRKGKNHEFRSASLSIYLGLPNESFKPQIFRAEWAGWARWDGATYTFQSGDSAHPHWQFDALEALQADASDERNRALELLREDDSQDLVRDFCPEPPSIRDLVFAQKLSRIHFPSAATWGQPVSEKRHAFSPTSIQEIRNWLRCSMKYLKSELASLKSRQLP